MSSLPVRRHRERISIGPHYPAIDKLTAVHVQPTSARLVRSDVAARVAVPTLDLMDDAARDSLRHREPLTYLGAIHEPQDDRPVSHRVAIEASSQGLERLLEYNLFAERPAGMFVYRIAAAGISQTSVVAAVGVDQFGSAILPHEQIRTERVRYLTGYRAQVGWISSPVAVAHRPCQSLAATIDQAMSDAPLLDFRTADGAAQTVWSIAENGEVTQAFDKIDRAYVTDGHHRVAAAREGRGATEPKVLTTLTPIDSVTVLAFHRVVTGIHMDDVLSRLSDVHRSDNRGQEPTPREGHVLVGGASGWWVGRLDQIDRPAQRERLDATLLHQQVLEPLGISPQDGRVQYVPALSTPQEVLSRHPTSIVLALAAPTFDDVIAVADAGKTLPPKSTYVRPKPHSGIFLDRCV